jgi:F-type H+-transporting ATPase subunit gamma
MATLKAIRRRISSVRSTQQITRAMQLVAAARLRRAQEALSNARPYHQALAQVARSVLGDGQALVQPLQASARPLTLLMVVGSDRGLCGGYNMNLLRKAEEEALRIQDDGREISFFAVGRKVADHVKRSGLPLAGESINHQRLATVGLARELAKTVLTAFQAGEAREIAIIYSHFHSAISQRPTMELLLPVSVPETSDNEMPIEYVIEPGRAEIVPVVLRRYIEASIFHALLEAEASELGARMTAMDNATNNASEMIERLTLEMNRARQASITRELMDIVGGAEALRG